MDPEYIQQIAYRDQLWASLRSLHPEIEQIARGQFSGTDREKALVQLLARIVLAELEFRASQSEEGPPPA